MKTATEQVDELMVNVVKWIDGQNTLKDVTDAKIHRWVNDSGHNQLDLEWSLRQLHCLVNAKLVDGAKDIARADASKGNIRSAREQAGELQSELKNLKRAASVNDFPIVSPKWELKVRDLEHFPQSGVTDEVKMDFL